MSRAFQVGDEVAVVTRGGWGRPRLGSRGRIDAVHKNGRIKAFGRMWRADGFEPGSSFSRARLEHWTPDLQAEFRREEEERRAERACHDAIQILSAARGADAVHLAALLPDELRRPAE